MEINSISDGILVYEMYIYIYRWGDLSMEINSISDGILVYEMLFKWAAIVCIVREKSTPEKGKRDG